jgi:hypothetical protein
VNGTETSSKLKIYTGNDFETECKKWKDANGNEKAYQYEVSDSNPYLTAYIPITLKAWKDGYTTLKFQTVGYCYDSKNKTTDVYDTEEKKIPITISIIGRTLFDLE